MAPQTIAAWVAKIARSRFSVGEYFRRHRVPFSRAQYFRYKGKLATGAVAAVADGRAAGNHRTLTPAAQAFIRGGHQADPGLSLQEISARLQQALGLRVDPSTISRFLHAAGLPIQRPAPAAPVEVIESACGGMEILAALALHLGWAQHTARQIRQGLERFRHTAAFRHERVRRDRTGRNVRGQFTPAYNRRADVRAQRFASVQEKRQHKNYSRMQLFHSSARVLERKCLAVLALPLVTLNGASRSADNPLGNALEHFCGYNYQHKTLEKFLRELKYLGISEGLLKDQVGFWQQRWREQGRPNQLPFLCYYVDGNTKPVWSTKNVKKSKVTMLGRVMGCLEQVFVHDGMGHPVYLETYSGKAPVGEHILSMFEKIEAALEGPGPPLKAHRVIVMDAASNSVATLRAFAAQEKYHYITALDENQWQPRKVLSEGRATRYRYGKATLRECRLELEDSKEKGYLIEVRAVRIEWDHGKRTVLVSSLPKEAVGASLVVQAYFERWPCEELEFRQMKAFASLNRVAGYGKQKLPDARVRARQRKLEQQIRSLRHALQGPLEAMAAAEERLAHAIERERQLKSHGELREGAWRLKAPAGAQLEALGRELDAQQRHLKALHAAAGEPLEQLERYEKEWLRLQGKEQVYRIDVELDQLMGFFRMALVNLASFFLSECLQAPAMSLARLLHTILLLPAQIHLTPETRRVILKRNPKDPELMGQLESALKRLSALHMRDLKQRIIEFQLS